MVIVDSYYGLEMYVCVQLDNVPVAQGHQHDCSRNGLERKKVIYDQYDGLER